jgi:hypothetical protein
MVKRRTDSDGRTSGRRNSAAWLMLLLPGFMFVGLLAPAAIKVQPKAEETYADVSFRSFAPRRPLQVPLTMAHAMLPEVGVEPVFSGARYLADQAKRVFELDIKNEDGKEIVLAEEEESEQPPVSALFDSSDSTVLAVDLTPLWDPALFNIIPGLMARDGYSQWEDFHGTGLAGPRLPPAPTQVPEPTTGALLALGLGALAVGGRR